MKIRNNLIRFAKNNIDYIFSFLLCGLAMFLFCKLSMLQFDTASSFITGDSLELYIPGLRSLARNIREGNSLAYSFELSMGMNAVEYYVAVVGASFVNLIYILFPNMSMETFIVLAVVLKGSLVGACFTYFARRVLKTEGYVNVFFSLFYALCGFQVSINSVNYIWMDMVYLLPLLLTFIVTAIEENKWLRLCLTYAYLFACNFYIAYIVGFFTAIFFILYLLLYSEKDWKKRAITTVKYAGMVIWAAGLVAVLMVPTAVYMLTQYPMEVGGYHTDIIGKNILLYLQRFTYGGIWSDSVRYPYLYCGIPCILAFPFYLLDRKIEWKEKVLYILPLAILGLSCVLLPLYIFWHGFDEPDMWYYRFAFIISFLMVAVACKEFHNLQNHSLKKKIGIVLVLGCFLEVSVNSGIGYGSVNDRRMLYVNAVLIAIWTLLAILISNKRSKHRELLIVLAFLLAMVEVISNGCIGHTIYQNKVEMNIWEEESKSALNLIKDDTDFYRVKYANDLVFNSDTYWGYKGISDFASFENVALRKSLSGLGAYTSSRVTLGFGLNPLTQMILGVKYEIIGSAAENFENAGVYVTPYPYVLGMGFMVDNAIRDLTLDEEDVFENCNRLAGSMLGEEVILFEEIPEEEYTIQESGVMVYQEKNSEPYFYADLTDDDTKYLSVLVPNVGKDAYVAIGNRNRGIHSQDPFLFERNIRRDGGRLGVRYTKKLEDGGGALYFQVAMKQGATNNYFEYEKYRISYANEEALNYLYQKLSENQMQVEKYENGEVYGKVNVSGKNHIMFTSIPFDSGWKVFSSKGEVKIIPLVEGAFLGLEFPEEGNYDIHLKYEVPGGREGFIISIVALMILVGLAGWQRVRSTISNREEIEGNDLR